MPLNGRFQDRDLAPIPGGRLRRDAARAFNAMNAESVRRYGVTLHPGGPLSSYRTVGQQQYLWGLYRAGRGNLAAYPGSSNHGWGLAIDLATPQMRHIVDEIGAPYGFAKRWSDAPTEWWHLRYREGVWDGRGAVEPKYPTLKANAKGVAVKRLQACLRRKGYRVPVTGWFGPQTLAAVKHYQRRKATTVDGVVGPVTWRMLRWRPPATKAKALPRPKAKPRRVPASHQLPAPTSTKTLIGPDVSVYQGDVDWKQVRAAGAAFAFVKATEGRDFRDKRFGAGRWKAMKDAGLIRGAYHFARPSAESSDAAAEARDFHAALQAAGGLQPGDLPPVLDLEVTRLSARQTQAWTADWVAEIRRLTGHQPILYVSPGFWAGQVGGPQTTFGCPLWIAHYGVRRPTLPPAWPRWTFWQHTDKGSIAGISTKCDMNQFAGDLAALRRLTI